MSGYILHLLLCFPFSYTSARGADIIKETMGCSRHRTKIRVSGEAASTASARVVVPSGRGAYAAPERPAHSRGVSLALRSALESPLSPLPAHYIMEHILIPTPPHAKANRAVIGQSSAAMQWSPPGLSVVAASSLLHLCCFEHARTCRHT